MIVLARRNQALLVIADRRKSHPVNNYGQCAVLRRGSPLAMMRFGTRNGADHVPKFMIGPA